MRTCLRKLSILILTFCCSVIALPAATAVEIAETATSETSNAKTLQQISKQLHKTPHLLGKFKQQKILPQLPQPLNSKGIFALSEQQGLSWRTLEPIASHTIFNEQQTTTSNLAQSITTPMLQILRGDFQALQKLFFIQAKQINDGWQLILQPRSTTLQKFITAIEVFGDQQINHIRLQESNQALTEIQLYDLRKVTLDDAQFVAEFKSH
ncbi:MAG: outer membrane lipoprotein carrier protein LolA [Gammaproteobacteria bacterium]|nr:outer membrane lipoprotein carrier protein LolA [Gammaproteobacteria bacterium]